MNTANIRGRKRKNSGAAMAMVAVSVKYAYIDGAHFFTSDDPKWKGLCAASSDLQQAWDDVSIQLNNLATLDYKAANPGFQPAMTFERFIKGLTSALEAEIQRRNAAATSIIKIAKKTYVAKSTKQVAKVEPVLLAPETSYIPPQVIAWKVAQDAHC